MRPVRISKEMLGSFWHSRLTYLVAALLCVAAVGWFTSEYFLPPPPTRITIATGPKGTTFDYFGQQYRERFARVGIDVALRETPGGVENFRLLHDPNSDVHIAFVPGGIFNSAQAPELLSLGRIFDVPLWLFYSSTEALEDLSQLSGKRIAIGLEGSSARYNSERILAKANINSKTATFLPLTGNAAVEALSEGKVDAVSFFSMPDAPAITVLLANPKFQLMDFPTAEGLTRVFPDLVRLVLPKGVIELVPPRPSHDVTLIASTAKVLIRKDVHPAIIQLLAQIMKEEHSGPGLFQRAGEFPTSVDPEFPMSQIAIDYYRNGLSLFQAYMPFWGTIYARRLIAFFIAAIAIVLPAFSFAPRLYEWFVRGQLSKLYRRLRVVENALGRELDVKQAEALQRELVDIDQAANCLPMRHSDHYFLFKHYLERTRSRLTEVHLTKKTDDL